MWRDLSDYRKQTCSVPNEHPLHILTFRAIEAGFVGWRSEFTVKMGNHISLEYLHQLCFGSLCYFACGFYISLHVNCIGPNGSSMSEVPIAHHVALHRHRLCITLGGACECPLLMIVLLHNQKLDYTPVFSKAVTCADWWFWCLVHCRVQAFSSMFSVLCSC